MKKIALIGAGQIGSRHLQALALLKTPASIYVVDPSDASLQTAKNRYTEIDHGAATQEIVFYSAISSLPEQLDLAIIACSADQRLAIFQELLKRAAVEYVVLEKVAFNQNSHLHLAEELAGRVPGGVYMNCTRRMHPIYQQLKPVFSDAVPIEFIVEGSEWDIGCNGIHFLDLYSYLSGDDVSELSPAFLRTTVTESKRPGYQEFKGTLVGKSHKGTYLRLSSMETGFVENMTVRMLSESAVVFVDESSGTAIVQTKANHWKQEVIPFRMLYQSELSHVFASDLFDSGACHLTPFQETVHVHTKLIACLNRHIHLGEDERCPIT